jgi:hypothetical protein
MSNTSQNDPETKRTVEDFKRMLRQKSHEEREALLRQARDEALAEELEEVREVNAREAAALREALSQTNPRDERIAARDQAKSVALLLLMLLLILWLIAAATGRSDILRLPGAQPATQPIQPRLGEAGDTGVFEVSNAQNTTNMPGIGSLDRAVPAISPYFIDYYNQNGGERIFGRPVSEAMNSNGRWYQWFERGRLEQWPEYAGTRYAVQGGLVGREFTTGYNFPSQPYFVSQQDARYFPETGHGVYGRFLQFWYDAGGLDILGYPISEQIQEVLPDKQIHTVQYFERGRVEYHPEQAPPQDMELGLLGRGLFLHDATPNIVTTNPSEAPAAASPR